MPDAQNPTSTAEAVQPAAATPTGRRRAQMFSREELAQLTARSDLWGAWAVLSTWGVIAAALAALAWQPGPLMFVLATTVIAGRQLCLAILQHEGAHGTLFRSRWANEVLTDWLCARPIWQNLPKYRAHHIGHHQHTGTEADPDISLHADYPVSAASLRRKFLRDLSGLTGLKLMFGLLMMDAGVFKWTVANHIERLPQQGRSGTHRILTTARNMAPMLLSNLALWGLLAALGHGWLYAAWAAAFVFVLPLFVRIRSVAEHGCMQRSTDMLLNTRTTQAGWLARATVAPLHVNFHCEHHLLASVPWQHLPRMHRLLRDKGLVDKPPSYVDVLRLASSSGI